MTVKIGCRADGRVAETLGDGCELHAFFEQEARVAVSQDVERRSLRQAEAPAAARVFRPADYAASFPIPTSISGPFHSPPGHVVALGCGIVGVAAQRCAAPPAASWSKFNCC